MLGLALVSCLLSVAPPDPAAPEGAGANEAPVLQRPAHAQLAPPPPVPAPRVTSVPQVREDEPAPIGRERAAEAAMARDHGAEFIDLSAREQKKLSRKGTWVWGTGALLGGAAAATAATAFTVAGPEFVFAVMPPAFCAATVAIPTVMIGAGIRGRYDGWHDPRPRAQVRRMEIGGWVAFAGGLVMGIGGAFGAMFSPTYPCGREEGICVTPHIHPGTYATMVAFTFAGPTMAGIGGGFGSYASSHRQTERYRVRVRPMVMGTGGGVSMQF
jgi:hypothetical protein